MKKKVAVHITVNGKTETKMTPISAPRVTWEEMGRANCASQIMKPKKGKGSYDRQALKNSLRKGAL